MPEGLAWNEGAGVSVDLYWIPLGAGHRFVRFNGMVYEAVNAAVCRRPRCDIYHSVLEIVLPVGRYTVEMTPVPDTSGDARGVVAMGPVGARVAGRLRLFRYEVRRWREGIVPDLRHAVSSPVHITCDPATTARTFAVLSEVPTPTWGRDELHTGEMWTCNSVIAWALASAGIDLDDIPLPPHGRAPGWDAGRIAAGRLHRAPLGWNHVLSGRPGLASTSTEVDTHGPVSHRRLSPRAWFRPPGHLCDAP